VSLRLLYLIFIQLLSWLLLLARSSAAKVWGTNIRFWA
jgi:hypothetical protein